SFFSAHEVSTCKISGCLSYRILDSGPDGTQTTLTREAPEMKYVFIEKHQAEFSIKAMCRVLRVARSGW
ncbi:hypothetical protein L3W84_24965, partial [Escherichia coli]|nr:hypothetical protein [Escherichia coli]